jgi:predicted nucleotidyltransferase
MAGLISLIDDEKMRTLFGKRELEIIKKQLLGINLSSSEKTRLSRDIRKKFEAIKELSQFSHDFKLKKGAEIKWIINDTKNFIINSNYFPKIKKIILFGSTTVNKRIFRSDIDIAVEFDKIDIKEASKFRIYVAGRVSEKVDIQVYNILPEKIKKEIDKKGRVIYERKNK